MAMNGLYSADVQLINYSLTLHLTTYMSYMEFMESVGARYIMCGMH